MKNSTVILGLGSNVGDRMAYLNQAICLLAKLGQVSARSPIYASSALLPAGAPPWWDKPFLNMAISLETALAPHALLAEVKRIESQIGRKQRGTWSPREIDIDLLAFAQQVMMSDELTLPHPGLLERDFALLPFADIAPDWVLDGTPAREIAARKHFHLPCYQPPKTKLVGILNITPDSFSDGGLYHQPEAAFARALALVEEGAVVVDIGAESTRPGAVPISHEVEWQRLSPVLEKLLMAPVSISIDTRHPETARKAAALGVAWVNDVSGFASDAMIDAVAGSQCRLVVMHSLSVPADRALVMESENVTHDLLEWAHTRMGYLTSRGIERDRIIIDPGIGFGKTLEQNWEIIHHAEAFASLGVDVLIGHSRKSFLTQQPSPLVGEGKGGGGGESPLPLSPSHMGREDISWRDDATLAASRMLVDKQINYLRVHDVAAHRSLL